MRRIFAAGRYGVLGFRSGSVPMPHVGPLLRHGFPEADHAIGCSISRPRTPRYPPRAGRPRRIPFQAARPAWTTIFPWFRCYFWLRRLRVRCRLIRLRAMGARAAHTTLSGFPGSFSKRSPIFGTVPGGIGATTPSVHLCSNQVPKTDTGKVGIRAGGRNAETSRLRPVVIEASEICAVLPPLDRRDEGRPAAGYPAACWGSCRSSGGSDCRIIAVLTIQGIDPRSITPYIANRRAGSRF